jgi:hypothetical protein
MYSKQEYHRAEFNTKLELVNTKKNNSKEVKLTKRERINVQNKNGNQHNKNDQQSPISADHRGQSSDSGLDAFMSNQRRLLCPANQCALDKHS